MKPNKSGRVEKEHFGLREARSVWITWTAGVFSLGFVLTAAAGLVAEILEIHLHLLTGLLHGRFCCINTGTVIS